MRLVAYVAMRAPLRPVPEPEQADATPWWALRLEELSDRELGLLSYVTDGHVPHEVRFNLEQLEAERAPLLAAAHGD
jgi:hypothetical protein